MSFLLNIPAVEVIGEAGDGQEAAELAMKLGPDMVLMDIKMPRLNGIEATAIIKNQRPSVRIILYSMHDIEECDSEALGTADRFIPKEELFEEIPRILKSDQVFRSGGCWNG